MKRLNLFALHGLVICALMLVLSCASNESNDQAEFEDGQDAAALEEGDASAADDLELLADEEVEEGASEELNELEGELADAENVPEESVVAASNEAELDTLLEGGGEVVDMNVRAAAPSGVPQIPGEAFEKGGALLNRFYFARSGENWDGLADKLLGDSSKGTALQTWNGRKLRPGKLVFYESPSNRSDSQMLSYYEEKNVQPEPYVLQSGELLSTVAKQKYGDYRSWKEIAALNGINAPEKLKAGSQLLLYPSGYVGGGEEIAQVDSAPPIQAADPAPVEDVPVNNSAEDFPPFNEEKEEQVAEATPPPMEQPEPQFTPPAQNTAPPVTAPTRTKKRKMSIGRILQQNMFAVAIGGIILVLLLALRIINRRKKAAAVNDNDLLDEGFDAAPRARRR